MVVASALSRALPTKLASVSAGGSKGGHACSPLTSMASGASNACISRSLPGLCVAMTNRDIGSSGRLE